MLQLSFNLVSNMQCICTKIIMDYSNGNVHTWEIQSRQLAFSFMEYLPYDESVSCMKWSKPYLVLGKSNEAVKIWKRRTDATFTRPGE